MAVSPRNAGMLDKYFTSIPKTPGLSKEPVLNLSCIAYLAEVQKPPAQHNCSNMWFVIYRTERPQATDFPKTFYHKNMPAFLPAFFGFSISEVNEHVKTGTTKIWHLKVIKTLTIAWSLVGKSSSCNKVISLCHLLIINNNSMGNPVATGVMRESCKATLLTQTSLQLTLRGLRRGKIVVSSSRQSRDISRVALPLHPCGPDHVISQP